MSDLSTAREIAAEIAAGRLAARDVCRETLARIAEGDGEIRAFTQVWEAAALAAAEAVDAARAAGRALGPLAGVPAALKDNLCTRAGRTTCGARILADYAAPYDATAVARLIAAGAVIVGKTNMDEFAMGSSTEGSAFFSTRNPHDLQRVPGGSSGGSAAAVAAGMVPIALGSDTGGSVRQPAAFCGVVGLKPTYGRVSRYGLVAYGSSLDQIGPLATNVTDAALVLQVIAGRDPLDATSSAAPVPDYVAALRAEALEERQRKLRIGVPREYFAAGLDAEIRDAVERAIAGFAEAGASTREVTLPHSEHALAAYYLIAMAECAGNLARYDGVRYGRRAEAAEDWRALYEQSRGENLGLEVKRRILLGTFALSAGYSEAYYEQALRVRRVVQDDFERALAHVDVLACPTTPTAAFRSGEKLEDPLQMYLADVYTAAVNLAGLPAISVPCGETRAGLPIGLQLIGRAFDETTVLQAARLHERRCGVSAPERLRAPDKLDNTESG